LAERRFAPTYSRVHHPHLRSALGRLAGRRSALAAQRVIIITDSLAAHAERLNVQQGAQWLGQIARWRFGDYAVVSSKGGWTTTRTTGRFFNVERAASEKFSFRAGRPHRRLRRRQRRASRDGARRCGHCNWAMAGPSAR